MFRTVPLSIIRSFSLYTQQWYISYSFADSLRAESCLQAVSKPVRYITLLCVLWKTPGDGKRNCPKHVELYSKNTFEKLVHLVGFIIRIYQQLFLLHYCWLFIDARAKNVFCSEWIEINTAWVKCLSLQVNMLLIFKVLTFFLRIVTFNYFKNMRFHYLKHKKFSPDILVTFSISLALNLFSTCTLVMFPPTQMQISQKGLLPLLCIRAVPISCSIPDIGYH